MSDAARADVLIPDAGSGDVVEGPSLTLRRPAPEDEATWVRLHRDPRTWTHAPHAMPATDEQAAEGFARVLRDWDETGLGYWIVRARDDGSVVGFAGAAPRERDGERFLNLYYRLADDHRGRGHGRAAARITARFVAEFRGDLPLRALVKEHNAASVATALGIGMERIGTTVLNDDLPDEPASTVLEAPRVHRVAAFAPGERERVLDLWCRVTEAGGAVGFLPGAARADIDRALRAHESAMAEGTQVAGVLRAPGGSVLGLGFLSRPGNPMMAHRRTAFRVMTDPDHRGRGHGQVLMAGLHRIAREDGVEIMTLGVRGGMGTEAFYASCGYREVGRVEGSIRVAPGDDRDDITMSRRLDR